MALGEGFVGVGDGGVDVFDAGYLHDGGDGCAIEGLLREMVSVEAETN